MANLELITGHGESDHISSFDMRASNRATFGKGKYILTDAENMKTTIVVTDKMLVIAPGSCMWSGMHVRNERELNVPFVSPASTDYVYFWLHYTRDASNLVESVEIVSTTSNKVSADLIYDELPDDVTDAYTLFYSFTFNPNGNIPTNLKNEFTVVKGMNNYFEESSQKLNAQAAENAQQLQKLTDEVNNTIKGFEGNIPAIALASFVNPVELGYMESAKTDGTGHYIALSEDMFNFAIIAMNVDTSSTRGRTFFFLAKELTNQKYLHFDFFKDSLYHYEGYISRHTFSKIYWNCKGTYYNKTSITGLASGSGFDYGSYTSTFRVTFYGIGRVAG